MPAPRPIVILGPTAGGKSELAVALAERLPRGEAGRGGGEVIGADSMQVYRRLDAGTAKPTAAQRARAAHHMIDIVEPTRRFTVADWLERVEPLIAGLQRRSGTPIVVGGTNLYIKALLEGMFGGPDRDDALRAELAEVPAPRLHERLRAVDPAAAERIHPNDHRKLVRALEVHHVTGRPISALQTQWTAASPSTAPEPPPQLSTHVPEPATRKPQSATRNPQPPYRHNPILIGLDWPVEAINRRINQRVKEMFFPVPRDGDPAPESLPDEVRRLEAAGLLGPQAREALGYKQVLDTIHSRCTLEEAFEQTKVQTRRFAKKQRTWLKRFQGVAWIRAADRPWEQVVEEALAVTAAER